MGVTFVKGLAKLWGTKYGGFVFSLICGVAYFIILLNLLSINNQAGGGLIALFIAPAVICGMALILIKAAKKLILEEEFSKLALMTYSHIVLLLLSVVFLIDLLK